jgi:hypothetical protein
MTDHLVNAFTLEPIARAIVDTVQAIIDRNQAPPSPAVQVATTKTIAAGGISYRRALSFDVPSESEPGRVHVVSLYLRLDRDRSGRSTWRQRWRGGAGTWRNEITGARCSCPNRAELPAADGRPPCKHILACLALARLEGYRLETPK